MIGIFVTTVTAKYYSSDNMAARFTSTEPAMSHVAYRFYDFELPYHVPWFCVGMAVSKFKQIGVWHKLPHALKEKTKRAQGNWSGLKITQKDLDAIPDDVWETMAVALGVSWRYATAAIDHDRINADSRSNAAVAPHAPGAGDAPPAGA